ncbi:MAG: OmpA family protein, partial [Salaquimonas sp.]|nr:OmpA family protein [Salaquimonas sp.]
RQPQQSPQPQQRQRPQDNFAGLLRDNRPASALTDAELRRRIGVFGQALQSGRLDGRMENRVRAMLDTDRGELDRRISATTGRDVSGVNADREARNLLQDRRPAARLNDDQLRDRVGRIRAVLSLPGLDPRSEEQLRRLLADDRDELRSRVALAQQPEKRQRFGSNPAQIDRRALRKNMFEAREERRRRLADPSYRIVIPNRPVKRRAPMPTIPLAEAYDQQLLDQLMAPPAYPIDRRYTIEEYRANPSLRTLMPGIEVDTVKFGFNEDFLREEEIVKLDRIGELMERIIAGNPNEAFVIEGHTDLVGSADYNEALSWRRADAVRQALTEFFYIPEQNLEIVGYGEQYPRIPTEFEEPENRRVTIRRITPILYGQQ